MHGSWKTPVGEYLEATFRSAPWAGSRHALGRPVSEDNWRLSPLPVMMLNGRPEQLDDRANVQSLKNLAGESVAADFTALIHRR